MALQGKRHESLVYLQSYGAGLTGVLRSSVLVRYWKSGSSSFATKALNLDDWREVGEGSYALVWDSAEMSSLGEFHFRVSGANFESIRSQFEVSPNVVSALITPETCLITGNISDLNGSPNQNKRIVFRPMKSPSQANGTFISGDFVYTQPTALGDFSALLIRNTKVVVEIEGVGLKVQFVVPNQETVRLIDVIPSITNIYV
jgi:hypothetical protein